MTTTNHLAAIKDALLSSRTNTVVQAVSARLPWADLTSIKDTYLNHCFHGLTDAEIERFVHRVAMHARVVQVAGVVTASTEMDTESIDKLRDRHSVVHALWAKVLDADVVCDDTASRCRFKATGECGAVQARLAS